MQAVAAGSATQTLTIEFDREDDGRWIADVPELPGVMVYGNTREDALSRVQALALRVIADKIEECGVPQTEVRFAFAA
jgi:predicted RNase H-like HicB family nuclease